MKKIVLLTVALVSTASMAFAATSIKNSKHDLSTGSTSSSKSAAGGTDQICIFCHTPHNAVVNVPLWNRSQTTGATLTYYNSPTLSNTASKFANTANGGGFTSSSVSLMCLTCHDGTLALGAYSNKALSTPDMSVFVVNKAKLGTDLANDHPVGFDYDLAQAGEDRLKPIATANTNLSGNAFFGSTGTLIECASCHKVHDNTFAPFLRISNTSSALCLACHNK